MSLVSVFFNLVLWWNGSLCWWRITHSAANHNWDLHILFDPSTCRNRNSNTWYPCYLCFVLLECFTSITWQRAKTVQMSYRTKSHNLNPLQTSFSQASRLIYTTGVTSRHSHVQIYTIQHQAYRTQPSPWTLKAHTHTLFIFNTARRSAELKTAVSSDNLMLDKRLSATIWTEPSHEETAAV